MVLAKNRPDGKITGHFEHISLLRRKRHPALCEACLPADLARQPILISSDIRFRPERPRHPTLVGRWTQSPIPRVDRRASRQQGSRLSHATVVAQISEEWILTE